jgi:hypothetical protein
MTELLEGSIIKRAPPLEPERCAPTRVAAMAAFDKSWRRE